MDWFRRTWIYRLWRLFDWIDRAEAGNWRIGEAWSLQPYAIYFYNRSNIDLYTFHKAEGGVMLRRDFR